MFKTYFYRSNGAAAPAPAWAVALAAVAVAAAAVVILALGAAIALVAAPVAIVLALFARWRFRRVLNEMFEASRRGRQPETSNRIIDVDYRVIDDRDPR